MMARNSPGGGVEGPKGYRFGRYRLISPLGVGGMAQVWLARKQIHGGEKVVAVKMPVDLLDLDGNNQAALLNEIHIASQLSHSNIAQVFDAGIHRGILYMELERIDGVDLEELLGVLRSRQSAVRVDVAVYIWRCVLEALHYAYTYERDGVSCWVIHRDLSPSNVLISSSGEVKVMDFGIAKMQGSDTSGDHIKGKPRYMPPEQIEGRTSTRVDLFAVAAIFWEMVEGKQFRHDVPRTEMIARALSGVVPPIASLEVDEYLRDIYARCTDPNPARRPANPGEVLALLRRWPGRVADPGTLREILEWQLEARRHSGYTDADHAALPDWVYRLVGMLQKIDAYERSEAPSDGAAGASTPVTMAAAVAAATPGEDAPAFFRRGRRSSGLRPPEIRPGIAPTEDAPLPGRPAAVPASPPERPVSPTSAPATAQAGAQPSARAGASETLHLPAQDDVAAPAVPRTELLPVLGTVGPNAQTPMPAPLASTPPRSPDAVGHVLEPIPPSPVAGTFLPTPPSSGFETHPPSFAPVHAAPGFTRAMPSAVPTQPGVPATSSMVAPVGAQPIVSGQVWPTSAGAPQPSEFAPRHGRPASVPTVEQTAFTPVDGRRSRHRGLLAGVAVILVATLVAVVVLLAWTPTNDSVTASPSPSVGTSRPAVAVLPVEMPEPSAELVPPSPAETAATVVVPDDARRGSVGLSATDDTARAEPAAVVPAVATPTTEPARPGPEPSPEPSAPVGDPAGVVPVPPPASPADAPKSPKHANKPKSKPVPRVEVRMTRYFGEGEIKIDRETWTITKTVNVTLAEGSHSLAWRPSSGEAWRTLAPLNLASTHLYTLRLGVAGVEVTSIPKGGR